MGSEPELGVTVICRLYKYVPLWRVWFSSSLLWDRVYKWESLGLEQGIIFQETDHEEKLSQGKEGHPRSRVNFSKRS